MDVPDTLIVMLQPPPDEDGVRSTQGPEVRWVEGIAPGDVFAALDEEMTKAGFGHLAQTLDVEALISNLRTALADALDGRRGLAGAWRSSAKLLQALGPDWAITDKGIEERRHGVVLSKTETPAYLDDWDWSVRFEAPCPDWADSAWWDFAVMRAMRETWRWSRRRR